MWAETIEEIASIILTNSPGFTSRKLSRESLSSSLAGSSNLPDPALGGEYLVSSGDEPNRWAAELSWELEWPGVYNARKKEARSQINAFDNNFEVEKLNKLIEINKLLADYILQSKKLDLLDLLSSTNDSIYSYAEHAAKSGEITLLDLNKIKLDNITLRATRNVIINERNSTMSTLSQIYGKDCTALLAVMNCEFPEITIPQGADPKDYISQSPEVMAAYSEIESLKAAKDVAKMEGLPNISFGYKHAYEDNMHFNGATFGITLPIFSNRNKIKAAEAAINEAEYNAKRAEESAELEISLLLNNIMIMREQVAEIEPVLTSTDYNSILLKAYESGIITVIDYLSERNYFATAFLELLDLKHTLITTRLDLSKYYVSGVR